MSRSKFSLLSIPVLDGGLHLLVRPKAMSLPKSVKTKQHEGRCDLQRTETKKVSSELARQSEDLFEKEINS